MTPSGIEPATFRLVTQSLNQLRAPSDPLLVIQSRSFKSVIFEVFWHPEYTYVPT